jgi:hypothetical protein
MLVIRPPGRPTRQLSRKIQGLGRALVFFVGGAAGAATVMSLVWFGGRGLQLSRSAALLVLSAASLLLAARDAGVVTYRLPHRRGQVERQTLLDHPLKGLLAHGFALGSAFYTFVHVSLVYLVFLVAAMGILTYPEILVLAALFAAGRSLPVVGAMFFTRLDADRVASIFMTRGLPLARTISIASLAVVAAWSSSALLGTLGS